MNSRKQDRLELSEPDSKERGPTEPDPKRSLLIQSLRLRLCHVLSLLRIHRPDCEHCRARQKCGEELRNRLEELGGQSRPQPPSHQNQDPLPRAG